MSGDFERWNNDPNHEAPKPTPEHLERRRADRTRRLVFYLGLLACLIYLILSYMGIIR